MSTAKPPTSLSFQTDRSEDLISPNETRKRKAEDQGPMPGSLVGHVPKKPFCVCEMLDGTCSKNGHQEDGSDDWDDSPMTPPPARSLYQINADYDPWGNTAPNGNPILTAIRRLGSTPSTPTDPDVPTFTFTTECWESDCHPDSKCRFTGHNFVIHTREGPSSPSSY